MSSLSPPTFAAERPTKVRYLVVAVAMLMSVLLYLDRFCISFVERLIKDDLDLSNEQMGWILSAFFWSYALGQVPSGWLSDRFGARSMLALYILLWSLFTAMTGLASGFMMLIVMRLGFGLAQAGAYPTAASLLSRWMPFSARGLASGVVAFGGRVGGFLAPLLTAWMLVTLAPTAIPLEVSGNPIGSWRPVLMIYGLVGGVVAVVFWLIFRNRPEEHPTCNAAEAALIQHGRPPASTSRLTGAPLMRLAASRSMWLCSLSQVGTNVGWVFLVTWLPRYLQEVHQVPLGGGLMAAIPLLAGWFGMILGGPLTDRMTHRLGLRWGRALPMGLTRFLAMAAYLFCLLPLTDWFGPSLTPWVLTAAFAMVAFGTDLGVAAVWAFNQDVGGRHVGSVLGWGNMWGNLGAAVSPPLLNHVVGEGGRWDLAFLVCAGSFFIAGLAALGVNATKPIVPAEE